MVAASIAGIAMKVNRLGGFDASLLALENESQPMHAFSLVELDVSTLPGGYTFEAIRDRLAARTDALPEFRARLVDSRLNLDTPIWVEDADFNIENHVHRVRLPEPGGRSELCAIAESLAATPLDRQHPLWDIWVLEGLSGSDPRMSGRVAAVVRTHHVFADGVTAGDLWAQFHAADGDAPPVVRVEGFGAVSTQRLIFDGLVRFAYRPWFLLTAVLPKTLASIFNTAFRALRGRSMRSPFSAPRTPFNGVAGGRRCLAWSRLYLDDIKAVKDHYNVKVNDVLLTLVSSALRQYLDSRGQLPSASLVAVTPIAVHDRESPTRNQMSAMFSSLYTDIEDPVERLKAVAAASSVAKEHSSAIGDTMVQDWARIAPKMLAVMMRIYTSTRLSQIRPPYNVSLSSVRGVQRHILGAPIITNYPFGPILSGVGLTITAASLDGNVDMGILASPDLLPDPWALADALPSALKELLSTIS